MKAMREIKLIDAPEQTLQVRLADSLVHLRIRWQPLSKTWMLSVSVNDEDIALGRQMPIRSPLISDARFAGELVVFPAHGGNAEPDVNAWAGSHILVWLEPSELNRR